MTPTKSSTQRKRSPIKQSALPQPGDGLRGEIHERVITAMGWAIMPFMLFSLMMVEWMRLVFPTGPAHWQTTVLFVVSLAICAPKTWRLLRSVDNLSLGLRGERTVGQALQALIARGYRVFHDLQQDGYNIDHVLIGPGGVFAIETKTISKPNDHDAKITHDGRQIFVDGHPLDRDPLTQAEASARRVRQILREQTGQDIPVKPVVLFPGWYIEHTTPPGNAKVYVANEIWFLKSFDYAHGRATIDEKTMALLAAGMEREQRRG